MAQVVREQRIPLAFADLSHGNKRRLMHFFAMSGVRNLTEVHQRMGLTSGAESAPPQWLAKSRSSLANEVARLHSTAFTSAVDTLAIYTLQRRSTGGSLAHGQLKAVRQIVFVESLQTEHVVDGLRILVPTAVGVDGNRILLGEAEGRSELRGLIAYALASLYVGVASDQRGLADAIYRLITCRSPLAMQRYLKYERGLSWTIPATASSETVDDEEEDDALQRGGTLAVQHAAIASTLTAGFFDRAQRERDLLRASASSVPTVSMPNGATGSAFTPSPLPAPQPLPSLESIRVRRIAAVETWTPPSPRPGGGRHPGSWSPPAASGDGTREKEIGRRGEEIVYLAELERVRGLGLQESCVIWTSRDDEYADHDIISVGDDSRPVYLEVKSTAGKGGRFYWPRAEFEKAVREREHYQLWRIYEADTDHPSVTVFKDPIGMMLRQGLRVDLGTLTGEVAPLDASDCRANETGH